MRNRNMPKQNKTFLQYAGLSFQLLVLLGGATYLGIKVDQWTHMGFPIATWLLPLLALVAVLIRIIRDTGTGK